MTRRKNVFAFTDLATEVDASDPVVNGVYSTYPLPLESYSMGRCRGVLAIEGIETGDMPRREFAPNALSWRELPLSLEWQPKSAEGHDASVVVGKIETITRDGNTILWTGSFDVNGEFGRETHRLAHGGFIRGVSVMIDDVTDSDVELVWPEGDPGAEMPDDGSIGMTMTEPEKVLFHHARIMNANFTAMPAMQEAFLELIPDDEATASPAAPDVAPGFRASTSFTVVPVHNTATIDTPWDGATGSNLPDALTVDVANAAFAWYDTTAAADGLVPRSACQYLHHEISLDGQPGEANVTACAAAIGALNGGRGESSIPEADRQGVYEHLAAHLTDAGQEAPPLSSMDEVKQLQSLTAAMSKQDPPNFWFSDPKLKGPTPFTVTDDGQCFGHLATWNTCHTSFMGQCITPPREHELAYFTTGELVTREGGRVAVGKLTFGTNHAPGVLGARPASEHYEHTGYVAADVSAGVDKFGIWVAGAVRPDLTSGQLRSLRAAAPSGDWRRIGGKMRLVAALMVNVPGFPVPRTRTYIHDGVQSALVASGILTEVPRMAHVNPSVADHIARSIGRDRATVARERTLAARNRVHK